MDKIKKILVVLGEFRVIGGAERQALILAENLLKKGYKVEILGQVYGDTIGNILKEKEIPYTIYGFWQEKSKFKTIKKYFGLIKVIRKIKPDYIIPFISYNSRVIGLVWKFTNAKFAIWNQRDEGRDIFGSKIEKFAINNLSAIVSNSEEGKVAIEKKIKYKKKIHIINNGVIVPENIENNYWKNKLNLEDYTIVSMIANLTKFKDHKTLLNSWESVERYFLSKNIKIALILAGNLKETTNELKALCFDLKLKNVFFIGKTDKVNELIEDSDLIAHSSFLEGCPNGVLEAMAQKKTVVATDIPGIHQALGEKYNKQCFVEKQNPQDLASKIINLLENNYLRDEIGVYNQKRIKTEFNIDKMTESYLKLCCC